METVGKLTGASRTLDGKRINLTFEVDGSSADQVEKIMAQDKLRIRAVKWREKRSIDANNYLWELLSQMAPVLHTTKEELYLRELQEYGVFIYLPGTDEDMKKLSEVFRIVINRGETTLTTPSGKEMRLNQLQCYKGSSKYDTLEMSRLIDGVVEDAKELGIDTMTPEEIRQMKERWHL
mgnify:CR=1 FL=1